ncbi:MAG: hypothetical protein IJ300_11580 [Clostridia bacterium]|nr:hypothetical protein [Clostridia bacterium]
MRSCIYCGRDLEKGEKCTCPGSVNARRAKENAQAEPNTDKAAGGWQESTYRTGYTKKKRKFSFKKPNFRKPEFTKNAKEVTGFTKQFIHDPVNCVSNPGFLKPVQIILIIIATALFVSLCGFFIGARFIPGIYNIGNLLQYTLSGVLTVTVLELMFILVLYLINRFMLRRNVRLMTFATRPAAALIPLMLFALLGAVLNFFSVYTSIMLLLTGFVINIILTYEAMRSEWSFMPASRTMYLLGAAYFIFFVVVFNFIRLY